MDAEEWQAGEQPVLANANVSNSFEYWQSGEQPPVMTDERLLPRPVTVCFDTLAIF